MATAKTHRPIIRTTTRKNGKIRVGTASWTDPGFVAEWYPSKLAARKRLAWYAEHFNLVEVNSTFYAVPSADTVQRWCDETPDDFVFNLKLHRLLSRHSSPKKLLPTGLRSMAHAVKERVEVTPPLEKALVEVFLEGAEPLFRTGKLGALLLQLSPSFSPRNHSLEELDHLFQLLGGHQVAVELRNRHWVDDDLRDTTVRYFKKRRIALVAVDAPESDHFMVMPNLDVVTDPDLAYFRIHGRNARGYISGRTVAERFDYKYSKMELEEIGERVQTLAGLAHETHVIFNNNKGNYAPVAAGQFRRIIEAAPQSAAVR